MRRVKLGITLTNETLNRLDELCKQLEVTRSQAISFAINSYVIQDKGKELLIPSK